MDPGSTLALVSELARFLGLAGDGVAGVWTGTTADCSSGVGHTLGVALHFLTVTTTTADIPVSLDMIEETLD
jgi:hypothetical protein